MSLLSHGPETPRDDDKQIAKAYKQSPWVTYGLIAAIGVAAYAGDVKAVVGVGLACIVIAVGLIDARLHDLAIRIRRTNLILTDLRDGMRRED